MRVAIIGRTEILLEAAMLLRSQGHEIAMIVTSKEAPEYTKSSEDFRTLAIEWGVPFVHTPHIEKTIEAIQSIPPIDIGVSLNYCGIIPQSLIDLFSFGILNAHGGDLPQYRGNACQAWAIINGEDRVGLCIHRMIGGELDSGDIIARDYFPLTINTKITDVYNWMGERIPMLFLDALKRLNQNPVYVLEPQSNDPKDALRCYPRKPEDGKIDWNNSAMKILRLINASNKPYAGAYCELEGKKVIVWDAELAPEKNFLAIPGQITLVEEKFVEVATHSGKLRIHKVEYDNVIGNPSTLIKSLRNRFK